MIIQSKKIMLSETNNCMFVINIYLLVTMSYLLNKRPNLSFHYDCLGAIITKA